MSRVLIRPCCWWHMRCGLDDRESQPNRPAEPAVAAATDISSETRELEGLARRVALALREPDSGPK